MVTKPERYSPALSLVLVNIILVTVVLPEVADLLELT